MDDATITRLNQINRDFYRRTASEFDQTRGAAWPGWERFLTGLPSSLTVKTVLDVGCGNGRFGVFLSDNIPPIHYHGIDNNARLLDFARAALDGVLGITDARFDEQDILAGLPDSTYDLVAVFGVIHHIPGAARRLDFMRSLAQRVNDGGILVFACWRFAEYDRFKERFVPWPDDITPEDNDYLLDWRRGEHALRYCHYIDDKEHAALVKATGLQEILTYRADGQTGDMNRYSILRKF